MHYKRYIELSKDKETIHSNGTCVGSKQCKGRSYSPELEDCKICANNAFQAILAAAPLEMENPRLNKVRFTNIPEYGNHMTIQEFQKACVIGAFTDGGGCGYYATNTKMTDIEVCPSWISNVMKHKYSHVVWFNK